MGSKQEENVAENLFSEYKTTPEVCSEKKKSLSWSCCINPFFLLIKGPGSAVDLFLVAFVLVPSVSVALEAPFVSSSTLMFSKLLQSIPLRENFLTLGCKPLPSFKPFK